ncbi:ATP-dependent DNA ligase [Propionibacteriaceae bacterium G1746]|uniref:ATP-dependent DNA ligase n=1 Tax=Aestuariimicrobium sp. G57 TaxID=3418485 RepID=UPI003C1635C8
MDLPIDVPVAPMLARLVDRIPDADAVDGGYVYEPKWDGFRCIVLRDGDQVELTSRMNKSLTSYFPEIVDHVRDSLPRRCVIDTEIFVPTGAIGAQHLDWDVLSARVHPSLRRVARMAELNPAHMVAFDVLAVDDRDLRGLPFRDRRLRLEDMLGSIPESVGLHVTAQTHDADVARSWFESFDGSGLDGIMVKESLGTYEYGRRSWQKVKHARTAEAVVVGYRRNPRYRGVGQLLLALYGHGDDALHYVGVISQFEAQQRIDLAESLRPLELAAADAPTIHGLPDMAAAHGLVSLNPTKVAEVEFDQLVGFQFRHPARFRRWRVDRDPRSCQQDQLASAQAYDLATMLD